jgi:hypothetical protein
MERYVRSGTDKLGLADRSPGNSKSRTSGVDLLLKRGGAADVRWQAVVGTCRRSRTFALALPRVAALFFLPLPHASLQRTRSSPEAKIEHSGAPENDSDAERGIRRLADRDTDAPAADTAQQAERRARRPRPDFERDIPEVATPPKIEDAADGGQRALDSTASRVFAVGKAGTT